MKRHEQKIEFPLLNPTQDPLKAPISNSPPFHLTATYPVTFYTKSSPKSNALIIFSTSLSTTAN